MKQITLSLEKEKVYEEVAKTTSYTATKMGGAEAYERIFTTDEDNSMLERFWRECTVFICDALKEFLVSENNSDNIYSVTLNLSDHFDVELVNSINNSLFSFFVNTIISKWFIFTNKEEIQAYATEAAAHLKDIISKVLSRKRPERP